METVLQPALALRDPATTAAYRPGLAWPADRPTARPPPSPRQCVERASRSSKDANAITLSFLGSAPRARPSKRTAPSTGLPPVGASQTAPTATQSLPAPQPLARPLPISLLLQLSSTHIWVLCTRRPEAPESTPSLPAPCKRRSLVGPCPKSLRQQIPAFQLAHPAHPPWTTSPQPRLHPLEAARSRTRYSLERRQPMPRADSRSVDASSSLLPPARPPSYGRPLCAVNRPPSAGAVP